MSLSLLTRRVLTTASRRCMTSSALTRTPLRVAFSTNAKKITDNNDTHMHDQFEIIEKMLEEGLVDASRVREIKAMLPLAVDAPDGETDGHLAEEMKEIQAIFEDVAAHKEEINARLAKVQALIRENQKTYAVDSPDGETDGHFEEEMEEVNHIIDDAAKLEDKQQVDYQHKMEDAVRKERARDPEHDW